MNCIVLFCVCNLYAQIGTIVITPQTRFTKTFVQTDQDSKSYYVISKKNGNLYKRNYSENNWSGERKLNGEELFLTSVQAVYSTDGYFRTFFALKNDGSLWTWGRNSSGLVGDNTGVDKSQPVKVLDNVKDVTIYSLSVWAVKNDGTVYAWGLNSNAILGFGDTETRYAPDKLPVANVKYISITDKSTGQTGMLALSSVKTVIAVTSSGEEYQWIGDIISKVNDKTKFSKTPKLMGKNNIIYSDNAGLLTGNASSPVKDAIQYKLMANGELFKGNELLASNVASVCCQSNWELPYISFVTKNGDLYASGKGIGDGANIPRKNPVLVFQNVIKSAIIGETFGRSGCPWLLTSKGELYQKDNKNSYKYELISSNVYMFLESGISLIYFTNNGNVYDFYNEKIRLFLEDVALPQIINTTQNTNTLNVNTQQFPIEVYKIEFANANFEGKIIDNYGETLYANKIEYLIPKIYFKCTDPNRKINLFYKIIKPNGNLESSTNSPSGYTASFEFTTSIEVSTTNNDWWQGIIGWGNKDRTAYSKGTYRFEIYSNSKIKLFETTFIVH